MQAKTYQGGGEGHAGSGLRKYEDPGRRELPVTCRLNSKARRTRTRRSRRASRFAPSVRTLILISADQPRNRRNTRKERVQREGALTQKVSRAFLRASLVFVSFAVFRGSHFFLRRMRPSGASGDMTIPSERYSDSCDHRSADAHPRGRQKGNSRMRASALRCSNAAGPSACFKRRSIDFPVATASGLPSSLAPESVP